MFPSVDIFVAILVGTSVLGIPGTILAIPVVLVAKTVVQHYAEWPDSTR